MHIYSKRVASFIRDITQHAKEILSKEMGLVVRGDRFYDRRGFTSYPLVIVIYNHQKILGYFDPNFYELGFHECMMHAEKKKLMNLIRHELAHYATFINDGEQGLTHGASFQSFCARMGWDQEVGKATLCLENGENIGAKESYILRKVQKLMALASSNHECEAEQAMIKAQELLLKHNLELQYIAESDDEKMVLKRVLKQKQVDAKMRSISRILDTFFVNTVFNRTSSAAYLEILGSPDSVEIAEYIAIFLNVEMENLWNQAKKLSSLKGTLAKNSFFYGLAKGYCDKIASLKRSYHREMSQALISLEKKLTEAKNMAYPRLVKSRGTGGYCASSASLGESAGRKLNINPAINQSSGKAGSLIGYLPK